MKFHLFMLIGDKRGAFSSPIIYAYTNNNALAKRFIETRDMTKFVYKTDNIDKETFNQYVLKYKSQLLVDSKLVTQKNITEKQIISLPVTQLEEEQVYVNADKILEELSKYTNNTAQLFNDEILSALDKLKYFDIYNFYNYHNIYYQSVIMPSDLNLNVDYLSLFIYFSGNTLKLKG